MYRPDAKSWQLVRSLLPDAVTKQIPADASDKKSLSPALDKLDKNDANRVKFLLDLVDLSNGSEDVVHSIATNPNVKTLRDVALLYNYDDVAALTTSPPSSLSSATPASSVGDVSRAVHIAAPTHTASAATAAQSFRKKLFLKEPTAVLHKMVQDAEIHHDDNVVRDEMHSFFTAHPDFNIRGESVAPLLKPNSDKVSSTTKPVSLSSATVKALKTLQRVQALTSDPAAIPTLLSAGVKSAQQVAAIPQAHFVSDMQLPDGTARDIHRHASNSVIRSNMALTTALQTIRGTGIRLIDGDTTRTERIAKARQLMVTIMPNHKSTVDLEQLFGSMDYCECSDCTSVTSPANYFVELLQFLRNNNLGPNVGSTPPSTGWAGTALEKLFRRRPDIADLELTCANTYTVLPYIDLSNEVMESFVVHLKSYETNTLAPKQADIQVFNVSANDDSGELLAQPRNVNYEAYCILKDAVYPFSLPYHQPIDEIRILLGFLQTSRFELMQTFHANPAPGTPDTPDSEVAFNRALTAEYLLLTQEDYKILTREAFYSKLYFETVLHQPNMTDATYQTNIGLLQPYAYWGYTDAQATEMTDSNETLQVGLTFVEAQFIPRSGLAYTDVVALVQTQFVNPNWPKGWALELLEKIRYSYAYLYSLIDTTKSKRMEQLAPVIAWLAKWQPVAELFEKKRQIYLQNLDNPSSGIDNDGDYYSLAKSAMGACGCPCSNYCIWKCWVLRYFELFGQLVVLDSRDGPVFGTEGWLILQNSPPAPPPIEVPKILKLAEKSAKPTKPEKPTTLSTTKLPAVGTLDSSTTGITDTAIGYLARDGSITALDGVTQIGYVGSDCRLMYGSKAGSAVTFVQQYAIDNVTNAIGLFSIDQTTRIGFVDPTTDELKAYLVDSQGNMNFEVSTVVQWGPVQDSCNLQGVRIIHLDGSQVLPSDYDRWQQFIRLWMKLGWTMDELDQALIGLAQLSSPLEGSGSSDPGSCSSSGSGGLGTTGLPAIPPVTWADLQDKCPGGMSDNGQNGSNGNCDDECSETCPLHSGDDSVPPAPLQITPSFLDQLAAVKALQNLTQLDLSQLLVFWADIGTHSGATSSLYQQLFLTTRMIALDPIFEADANGNYLTTSATISAHAAGVMAALQIFKPSDLATLVTVANIIDGLLTLDNLSAIFRYKLLAGVLSIPISQLPAFVSLFGDPFASGAIQTLHVINEWNNVSNSGFTLTQLCYIVTGVDSTTQPVGPSQISILKTCKSLSDGLISILKSYPDPDPTVPVTSDMVGTAAGLLFNAATVASIQSVLNGTSVWTTNAPTGLNLVIPDSLSAIVTYKDSPATTTSAASATVTATHILTTNETTAILALVKGPNATLWSQAVNRLLKQPTTWFQNTLSGIFSDPIGAIAVLLAGDVPASTPAPTNPGDPTATPPVIDPGTAPGKREYFLENFMPFLRSTMEQQLVTDTMTSVSGLSSQLTTLLLDSVLKVTSGSTTKATAMSVLMGLLNEPAATPTSSWTGYLVPPSTDSYTFVAIGDTQPASITLGDMPIGFPHQQADPNNVWSSDPVNLTAGTLITLADLSGPATQLQWKTARSPMSPIPSSALLSAYATGAMSAVFVALVKVGVIISNFNLSADEVAYFQKYGADFSSLDFNHITLPSWNRLCAYYNLRQSLQSPNATLLVLFQWAVNISAAGTVVDIKSLLNMIVASTAWDPVPIQALISSTGFSLTSPASYRNEIALTQLRNALTVFNKVGGGGGSNGGIDIPTLFSWARPLTKFESLRAVAAAIRKSIYGSYPLKTWEQAVQPLNNKLREDQKNALIAHLVVQPVLRSEGITDADSLFEFFLIDVQMSSCLQTSRLKQAISTVQLFIQRCLLGLELDETGNPVRVDGTRWSWMNSVVLWQGNREAFLYPENWLVPSLRDDKSSFYSDMESSLMQKPVNKDAIIDTFKNYFYDVDLAANLLVKGLFLDSSPRQDSILHIISCTRHTPQVYYYRQLDTSVQSWTPWETMTVDIPSYSVEATTGSSSSATGTVTESGSYVTPVVWNGRVFVFFPTFSTKTLPSTIDSDTSQTMSTIGNTGPSNKSAPVQYYYITMNMSERRNGVWTPKQMSTEGVYEDISNIALPTQQYTLPPVNSYAFIPRCVGSGDAATLSVDVMRQYSSKLNPVGRFDFVNGRLVRSSSGAAAAFPAPDLLDFGADTTTNEMHSWQASTDSNAPELYNQWPFAYYPSGISSGVVQLAWNAEQTPSGTGTSTMTNFYHGFVHQVLARLSTSGDLGDAFSYYQSTSTLPLANLSDAFGGNTVSTYNELAQPYALYNWEACYHALIELANRMLAQSQFDQALALCQYMFNPMVNSNDPSSCWLFRPFQYIQARDYLENFFNNLQPGVANEQITQWRNNAFQPYVVARSRPVAFMKALVMLYIRILIAYGDNYFRQNTLETVPLAIQCYVVAGHIYGQPGQKIPSRGTTTSETFRTLCDKLDAFDDAVVDLELMFPFSNQIDTATPIGFTGKYDTPVDLPNIFGSATTRYFCIPQNDQLLQLRATIGDRLYKLRHCQDINGHVQQLALWQPPLDVGALVAATAAGLSISSVLSDLNSPMPNYRFYQLLQKAHEVIAELKSLTQSWLSAKEKEDGEALAILRQQHELQINQMMLDIKQSNLDEAKATLDQLTASLDTPKYKLEYFLNLLGMDSSSVPKDPTQTFSEISNLFDTPANDGGLMLTPSEAEQMDKAGSAKDMNVGAGIAEALASVFMALPSTTAHGTPLGVGVAVKWGFPSLGHASSAVARGIKIKSEDLTAKSSLSGLRSTYLKQRQDRVNQANAAGYEMNNINKQILTQNFRIKVATKDIDQQQQQVNNSQDVLNFLQTKYTNQQLYTWLDQQTQGLAYTSYTLAYDLAKRVENAYHFERPLDTRNYIQYGYWDPQHNGLLAGESLGAALRSLEAAYQLDRGYDYEIVKNVSLRLTQPMQLLALRQTGSCQIELPEIMFDMDFPGHYLRRIKAISLTLPCVTGPYTAVSCTLRLLTHTYRISPTAKGASDYPQTTGGAPDPRFATTSLPISAIATSTAQNDAGVFELDFRGGERYLPFEGAGVISTWSLQLPDALRQFDYSTIADAIMTVRYTSNDGGSQLQSAAGATVAAYVKSVANLATTDGLFTLWDLKAEFATQWYRIATPPAAGSDPTQRFMTLQNLNQTMPVFTATARKITVVDIYIISAGTLPTAALSVALVTTTASGTSLGEAIVFTEGKSVRSLSVYQALGANLQVGTWQFTVADDTVSLERIFLVVRYQLS